MLLSQAGAGGLPPLSLVPGLLALPLQLLHGKRVEDTFWAGVSLLTSEAAALTGSAVASAPVAGALTRIQHLAL